MNETELTRCHELLNSYLVNRGNVLKRVLLLLDARHGIKIGDINFLNELMAYKKDDSNIEGTEQGNIRNSDKWSWKLQIVLTKCDLVERFDLARTIQIVREKVTIFSNFVVNS